MFVYPATQAGQGLCYKWPDEAYFCVTGPDHAMNLFVFHPQNILENTSVITDGDVYITCPNILFPNYFILVGD